MKAFVPAYEMKTPGSVHETASLLEKEPGKWTLFAGGTDIMPLLNSDKLPQRNFLNIYTLKELKGIRVTNEKIIIGALTTHAEIKKNPILTKEFPLLCEAASQIGAWAIQNRGTIGGNIANLSPAADSCPPLLVYDAKIVLTSAKGDRRVDYTKFHTDYKRSLFEPQELIVALELQRPAVAGNDYQYFKKIGSRKAEAISKVNFAGIINIRRQEISDVRIAIGSVAPVPMRCIRTEKFLLNRNKSQSLVQEAVEIMLAEISPIDDIRSSREYRSHIASNVLAEFITNGFSFF